MKEIQNFLNKSFNGNKTKKLGTLLSPLKHGHIIPKGTLVIMASGDMKLRIKILEKDTPHKGFSTPLILNSDANELMISPNYLHWYLSHEILQEQLMKFATGTILLRIPKNIIDSILVPIPTHNVYKQTSKEVVINKQENDGFKELVNNFYEDYLISKQNKRYRIAVIIAGAISEAIIYQLLLDEGVDKSILDNDRNLGLAKLTQYTKLLKLDKALNLPMSDFASIQKKRNAAVHFGAGRHEEMTFTADDLKSFDLIVKYFGI